MPYLQWYNILVPFIAHPSKYHTTFLHCQISSLSLVSVSAAFCTVYLYISYSHIGKGRTVAGKYFCSFFLFLIFIFLYIKNVFLQYLSCQFITKWCRDFFFFYFYWKDYYSYGLLFNWISICIECLLMLNRREYITFTIKTHSFLD